VPPLNVSTCVDPFSLYDARNGNIELSIALDTLQAHIDDKQAVVANVSDNDIGYLNGVTSSIH